MCFGNKNSGTGVGAMKKRKKTTGRVLARVLLVATFAAALVPFHLCNDYLRSADFDTVKVARKDSVWTIASRYTTKEEDARELVEAIIEVNGLSADGALRTGQNLRVPVLRERLPQFAER